MSRSPPLFGEGSKMVFLPCAAMAAAADDKEGEAGSLLLQGFLLRPVYTLYLHCPCIPWD